ncbi:PGR5-like protein 1B, chloroplastic [Castilleja foliolosa]|uniref:PGR5-like protein 1B, chloroplastic n=1 Tax=Castilleja foliolosa TaxID=1961234 RepID=A0ABD3BPB6_9LAMI
MGVILWLRVLDAVYSDLNVDYLKMFLLNVPAAVIALGLFFFLDDLTGFEITYLLELSEPFSFLFTWFAAIPVILWLSFTIANAIVKDFLILVGPVQTVGQKTLRSLVPYYRYPVGAPPIH